MNWKTIKQKHINFVKRYWNIYSYWRYRVLHNKWMSDYQIDSHYYQEHISKKRKPTRLQRRYKGYLEKYGEWYCKIHYWSLLKYHTDAEINIKYLNTKKKTDLYEDYKRYITKYIFGYTDKKYKEFRNIGYTDEEIDEKHRARNIGLKEIFTKEDYEYIELMNKTRKNAT